MPTTTSRCTSLAAPMAMPCFGRRCGSRRTYLRGLWLAHAVLRLDDSGFDLLEVSMKTLTGRGYSCITTVLSPYAYGDTTGIVMISSVGATHTAPISDGYGSSRAILCLDLVARDLTEYLEPTLTRGGYSWRTTASRCTPLASPLAWACFRTTGASPHLSEKPTTCLMQSSVWTLLAGLIGFR